MELKWYCVNTQTGSEATAKASIEKCIKQMGMESEFGEILIPAEDVIQLVKGKKSVRSRKFFPGYIFVQMNLTDEACHLVKGCSKVSGFVGSGRPSPIPLEDVQRITQQMKTGTEKPRPKVTFSVGESVVVIDGPFSNFNGSVEDINEEKAKVKVLVSIFGRSTPVELDFVQVEKA